MCPYGICRSTNFHVIKLNYLIQSVLLPQARLPFSAGTTHTHTHKICMAFDGVQSRICWLHVYRYRFSSFVQKKTLSGIRRYDSTVEKKKNIRFLWNLFVKFFAVTEYLRSIWTEVKKKKTTNDCTWLQQSLLNQWIITHGAFSYVVVTIFKRSAIQCIRYFPMYKFIRTCAFNGIFLLSLLSRCYFYLQNINISIQSVSNFACFLETKTNRLMSFWKYSNDTIVLSAGHFWESSDAQAINCFKDEKKHYSEVCCVIAVIWMSWVIMPYQNRNDTP